MEDPSHRPDSDSKESEGRSDERLSSNCRTLDRRGNELTDSSLRHIHRELAVVVLERILKS